MVDAVVEARYAKRKKETASVRAVLSSRLLAERLISHRSDADRLLRLAAKKF